MGELPSGFVSCMLAPYHTLLDSVAGCESSTPLLSANISGDIHLIGHGIWPGVRE